MATSTYFGWAEPDDTDLVKNGASAMRTLGNAIDSTVWDLTGGMAGKNLSINGGMDWWQRGTSSSSTGYLADRWYNAGSNTTYSQETTAANLPAGFRYGLKMTMTATDTPYAMQAIETRDAIRFAGKRVTLSYYAATSNSTDVTVRLDYSTSADTGVQGSFTQISPVSGNANQPTTTTMSRVSVTYDVPSTALTLRIIIGSNASLVSGRTVTITGVQLELGSKATQFTRAGGTAQGELAACQRYYWRTTGGQNNSRLNATGAFSSSTNAYVLAQFPVTMRTQPTSIDYSTLALYDFNSDIAVTNLVITSNCAAPQVALLTATVASGGTQYRPVQLEANNSSTAYIGLSAEL